MRHSIYAALFLLFIAFTARAQDSYYNVIKYGARNDSTKLSTAAIAKAIAAASKAGGGTVYFPAGTSGKTSTTLSGRGLRPTRPVIIKSAKPEWL